MLSLIPVELCDVDVRSALEIPARFNIYAYDAYFLECAIRQGAPLLTLDRGMRRVAKELPIEVLELPRLNNTPTHRPVNASRKSLMPHGRRSPKSPGEAGTPSASPTKRATPPPSTFPVSKQRQQHKTLWTPSAYHENATNHLFRHFL